MKKAFAILLLAALACVTMAACQNEPPHEHTYDSVWLYDEAQHWHGASCEHEDQETDRMDHVDADGNDICDVCGYIADHTHTFEAAWTCDEQTHYYKASCGHNVKKEEAQHTDANNDGSCDVCAYNGGHEHSYDDAYSVAEDEGYHWYAPNCGHSVAGLNMAAHVDEDNDGACDVCAYNGGHEHTYAEEWSTTGDEHWREVTCGHSIPVADKGVHKDEDGNTACDVCGYAPEHFHTFEDGWTADESGHWHKATCEHSTVKKEEAEHDGFSYDGVCDTCGFTVFRTVSVTVSAPDFIRVTTPAGQRENSFLVRENTDTTFQFTLPVSAEFSEIRGATLQGDPVTEENGKVYTAKLSVASEDMTVTIVAYNLTTVDTIVSDGQGNLAITGAFKGAYEQITFDAPEAGKYVIFSTTHPEVSFGLGEIGEDGYPIYDQVYVMDVAAPGSFTVKAYYFPWSVPEDGKLAYSYVIARYDSDLILKDLVSDGYTLPTNVDTTVHFVAPKAGRYQITSSMLGLAWNDYICNSIIVEATEDQQPLTFTVRYENTNAISFSFDCSIELMETTNVAVGDQDLTAPYGGYQAITLTAEQAGAYKITAQNPNFRFFVWNETTQTMNGQGISYITDELKVGESCVFYLSLDTFDYTGTDDITDKVTVSYLGHIPAYEEYAYPAIVNVPNTFVNENDAAEFKFTVSDGAAISLDGSNWYDSLTVYCGMQDTVTYWVKPATGVGADTVFVSVETVEYTFTLSVGTQTQVMVPGKEYSVFLTGSADSAYFTDYVLSWNQANVTVTYNAAPVISGALLQDYVEYYPVVMILEGTETTSITFTLEDPSTGNS